MKTLRKKSNENKKTYLSRLEKNLTPLSKIYSRDRISQENKIIWNTYVNIQNLWSEYLYEKFKDRNDIFITDKYSLFGLIPNSENKVKFGIDLRDQYNIKKAYLNDNINVIVIPYIISVVVIKDNDEEAYIERNELKFLSRNQINIKGNHVCCIIINKYLKTLEFYDSNGSIVHSKFSCEDLDEELFIEELNKVIHDMDKYKIYMNSDICPKEGFQNMIYSNSESEFRKKSGIQGFCTIWSLFNTLLRIKYYMIEPEYIFELLFARFKKMDEEQYWKWLRNWILHIFKTLEI